MDCRYVPLLVKHKPLLKITVHFIFLDLRATVTSLDRWQNHATTLHRTQETQMEYRFFQFIQKTADTLLKSRFKPFDCYCLKTVFALPGRSYSKSSDKVKMNNWKESKEKYLAMGIEEKRAHYKTKSISKIEDIPTWKSYSKTNELAHKKDKLVWNEIKTEKNKELAEKVSIFNGDITTLEIDAIVNAANSTLLGGGGVDGAIHLAAGPELKEECQTLNGCEPGEAKITGGYKLPAKYVIHTVGPRGEKPAILIKCYNNSFSLLAPNNLRTVAFPCIATGIYGYPNQAAAHVALYETRKYLEKNSNIDRVIFCIFLEEDKAIYEGLMQSYFPVH